MSTSRKLVNSVLAVALLALGLQVLPAGGVPTKRNPDYCRASGPLSAASLPNKVPAGECNLVGRVVTNGTVAVHVPARGHGVAADPVSQGAHADLLVATMPNGDVFIHGEGSDAGTHVTATNTGDPCADGYATGCLDPCVDTAFAVKDLNGGQNGGKPKVKISQPWYFKGGSVPDELTLDEARTHVKAGTQNIVKTNNDCSLSDVVDKPAPYEGGTTHSADMAFPNGQSGCKPSGRTDGKNVVDFGKLIFPTVGLACSYFVSRDGVKWFIKQADIRLRINGGAGDPNPGTEWTTNPDPNTCVGLTDVQSVMTHERGHAYGLSHPNTDQSHFLQTMYFAGPPCYMYARTLGKGDRKGLAVLY